MLKILLVDDEPIFRMGLRSGISWEAEGCKIVGEAKNGEEALLMIDEKKPDLVLLDLKMPKVDGIEVLRKMKNRKIKPKFIVLSCFNEYEYVREAMKLGACDYLFKPLMEGKDIAAAVHEIAKAMDHSADTDLTSQIHFLLEGILTEPEPAEEKIQAFLALCPALENTPYFALAVKIPGQACSNRKKEALLTLCKSILLRCFDDELPPFFTEKDQTLYGLFFTSAKEGQDFFPKRKMLLKKIKEYVEHPVRIGCSQAMKDPSNLKKALEQAQAALGMHFFSCYTRSGEEFLEFCPQYIQSQDLSLLFENQLKSIKDAFGKYRLEHIKNTLMEICRSILSRKLFCERDFPHMLAESIVSNMRLYQHRDLMEKLMMEEYNVISNLYHQETMEDTCNYFLELLERIFDLTRQSLYGSSHSDTIQNSLAYMEAHFSEKISLSDISRRAGMSEKYFCRLFREQTGDTFVGALTVIRIRAAEKMLSQTNLRTYEIAEQAGFGDYHHFCKTFKRLTGKTPTEFRTG